MTYCLFPSKKKNPCLKIILQAWHQTNKIWYKIEGRVVDTDGWGVGSEFNSYWFTLCRITLGWIGNGWLLRCDGLHSSDCVRSGSWDQSHSLSPTHGSSSPPVSLPRCLAKEIYISGALFAFKCSVPSNVIWWMTRRMLLQARLGGGGLSPEKQGRAKLWVHRSGILGETLFSRHKNQLEYHVKFYASLLKYIWANGPCVVQYSPFPLF